MVVFLRAKLKLELHPDKVLIATFSSGIDFLGWVHFPQHRILRTVTKRRLFRSIVGKEYNSPVVQSYRGLLQYGNTDTIDFFIKVAERIAERGSLW